MKYFLFIMMLVISLSVSPGYLRAQQTDEERMADLREQIEQLEEQAQRIRTEISERQDSAKTLQNEIKTIESQIRKIEAEISLLNAKINKTTIEIDQTEDVIVDTETSIDRKKDTVGQLLLSIQRRDNETLLATLLKYDDLSDFFREADYISAISNNLLALIDELKGDKENLENQKAQLEDKKLDLQKLSSETQYHKLSLSEVKTGKNTLLKDTKGQEAQYQKMLKEVEQRKALFFTELRELETHIIQGGLYLVHITATDIPPKGTAIFQWPEDGYKITQGYGYTAYARRGAYGGSPHNGIDLASGFGSIVKAIGDGEIVANGFNSGWGNWVAIKHSNNMVSVYGHMSSLSFLRVGTAVKAGDTIGFEGSTGNSTGSHLHLSLYTDFFTYVNEKNGQLYFNYLEGSVNPTSYLP